MIRTVTGDFTDINGPILCHEHLQIDLCCQKGPAVVLGEADQDDVINDLTKAMQFGLKAVVDLSVLGSGRNVAVLKQISQRAGLPVICATGFYWDPMPPLVYEVSVEALRDIMIEELTEGIEGSGIRAGVIKIGTHHEIIPQAERLFQAAALASLATGAAVITHTSAVEQAFWHLDTLERAGMDPSRILISHMGAAKNIAELIAVARRGALMGIDKVGFIARRSNAELADLVRDACEAGLASQIILSSDVARRDRLMRYGGSSYGAVFADFFPMLRERGVSAEQIDVMMRQNPQRILQLSK
ncbi:MAG: putative phosphotriesterase [Herbaspirillum sp.]|nr:putative phosphotriesterase [Herbaspirillum sp.]